MPTSTMDSDPAIGDIAGLDGDIDAIARNIGYADGLEYAGFWIRLGAVLIDTILLMFVTMPLLIWIYGWGYVSDGRLIHGPAEIWISWVAPAIATVLFWRLWQATPGKAMLSLRVVDAESGKTLSFGQAAARYLCYILSMLPLCLGFIWVAFDRRKETGLARQDRANRGGAREGSRARARAVQHLSWSIDYSCLACMLNIFDIE